jgi:hypothetical protein
MATTKAQDATPAQADKATTSPRVPHGCACLTGTGKQCPDTTLKAFHQGHDARLASRVAQAIADSKMTEAAGLELVKKAGGSDLLIGKTKRSAQLRAEKAAGAAAGPKTTKAATKGGTKATAEQAQAMAKAAPSVLGTKLKVAHNGKAHDAVVVRNAAGDLVARHRINGKDVDHAITVEDGKITVQ